MRRLIILALAAFVLLAAVAGPLGDADQPSAPVRPATGEALRDPLAYEEDREDELADAAARGFAHPLYTRVPGGARASAARVARLRPLVEEVAGASDVDADDLEALVYLESAGDPGAAADPRFEGAVGLTQIVAQTGSDLLDMRVDPQAARRLTRSIVRAQRRGRPVLVRRLRALRAAADERFDPAASLRGTARYLRFAREQLGRDDLALAAYHMGVGNLQAVQRAFGSREASYVELYFDSSPLRHRRAWRLLSSLGDDSATYLWRLRAAREVMKRFREDPEDLGRRAALMIAKNSAEEVLHPPDETETFEDGEALREAYDDDELLAIDPALLAARGLRSSRQMGELARDPRPYRGLRREALAALVYIGAGTRAITGAGALTLTSTVRDRPYQRRLVGLNPQATRGYSLHTTGFAFDLAKRFRSADQEAALRFVLRRLQAHDLIAYVEEFGAFHVVAGEEASVLQGVLEPDEG